MAGLLRMSAVAVVAVGASAGKCPGSGSMVHAKCSLEVEADTSCANVKEEMQARVSGQPQNWHDPHNGGTYSILESGDDLTLQRVTANGKYTDKMTFQFSDEDGKCQISGCSESQVFSVADFSTNYCNLRMLYCGSKEGCKAVKHDFGIEEMSVSPSLGAGKDPSSCLKTEQSSSLVAASASSGKCPGSASMVHAKCSLEVEAGTSCANVKEEMNARVSGQPQNWHDPHNGGTYSILASGDDLTLQRVTANGKYTDKMTFQFSDEGEKCQISGCSESQVFSVADFSTNYCNLRMLYCGSKEGCKAVKHDFDIEETSVSPSLGASKDPSACLKTQESSSLIHF